MDSETTYCNQCNGSGESKGIKCPECRGSGEVIDIMKDESVYDLQITNREDISLCM